MKTLKRPENIILLVISLAILIYLAIPLFQPGLPVNNDREVYPTWLTEFEQNIKDGNLIPRWAPNLWHGMGSPLFIFVSPGFYYLAQFFRLGSFGILLSVKLAIFLSLAIGYIFMFLLAKKLWGKWPALLCATVYTFMPYHLGLITPRGGYAELLAMGLWPLSLYIFYQLIQTGKIKYWLIGVFAVSFQMLAHNILSVIFIPLLFFFIIFFNHKSKLSKWLPFTSLLLGVLLASFFWLPAFVEKTALNLEELTEGVTMNMGHYNFHNHFIEFNELIHIDTSRYFDQVPKFLSYLGMLIILTSLLFIFKRGTDKNNKKILLFWMVVLFVGVFMSTSSSVFIWESIPALKLFQYPGRWLSIVSLAIGLSAGVVINVFKGRSLKIVCLIFSAVYIFMAIGYTWPAEYYPTKEDHNYKPAESLLSQMVYVAYGDNFYDDINRINLYSVEPSTIPKGVNIPTLQLLRSAMVVDDTRKIQAGQEINLPIFPKIEKTEEITITESEIKSTEYRIKVRADQAGSLIINTLYFPGWQVWLDGQPFPKEQIIFHDKLKTMGITIPQGDHQIIVKFVDTPIRIAGKIISILTLIIAIVTSILITRSRRLDQDFRKTTDIRPK